MTCIIDYGQNPVVFRCTVCNNTAPLPLPIQISQLAALVDDFHKKHKACACPPKNTGKTSLLTG